MGVDMHARVENETELRERAQICDQFLPATRTGRNLPARTGIHRWTIGPLRRFKRFSRHPEWYDPDGFHRLPILELKTEKSATPGIYSHAAKAQQLGEAGAPEYVCPADVEPELAKKLHHLALRGHQLAVCHRCLTRRFPVGRGGQPAFDRDQPPARPDPRLQRPVHPGLAWLRRAIRYEDLILEILYHRSRSSSGGEFDSIAGTALSCSWPMPPGEIQTRICYKPAREEKVIHSFARPQQRHCPR
jgi:hypothetical protein